MRALQCSPPPCPLTPPASSADIGDGNLPDHPAGGIGAPSQLQVCCPSTLAAWVMHPWLWGCCPYSKLQGCCHPPCCKIASLLPPAAGSAPPLSCKVLPLFPAASTSCLSGAPCPSPPSSCTGTAPPPLVEVWAGSHSYAAIAHRPSWRPNLPPHIILGFRTNIPEGFVQELAGADEHGAEREGGGAAPNCRRGIRLGSGRSHGLSACAWHARGASEVGRGNEKERRAATIQEGAECLCG